MEVPPKKTINKKKKQHIFGFLDVPLKIIHFGLPPHLWTDQTLTRLWTWVTIHYHSLNLLSRILNTPFEARV